MDREVNSISYTVVADCRPNLSVMLEYIQTIQAGMLYVCFGS
jgi:hypothetical protein